MPFKGKQPREGSEHLRMDAQWLTGGGGGGQPQTSQSYEKMMENHYKMHPPSWDATVEASEASCIKTGSRVCLRLASRSTDEVVKRENTNSESCWCHRSPESTDRKSRDKQTHTHRAAVCFSVQSTSKLWTLSLCSHTN